MQCSYLYKYGFQRTSCAFSAVCRAVQSGFRFSLCIRVSVLGDLLSCMHRACVHLGASLRNAVHPPVQVAAIFGSKCPNGWTAAVWSPLSRNPPTVGMNGTPSMPSLYRGRHCSRIISENLDTLAWFHCVFCTISLVVRSWNEFLPLSSNVKPPAVATTSELNFPRKCRFRKFPEQYAAVYLLLFTGVY